MSDLKSIVRVVFVLISTPAMKFLRGQLDRTAYLVQARFPELPKRQQFIRAQIRQLANLLNPFPLEHVDGSIAEREHTYRVIERNDSIR